MRRHLATALFILAMSVAPAFAAETLNVFSARTYPIDKKLFELFAAKNGVAVNIVKNIDAADAVIFDDSGQLAQAKIDGKLQAFSSDALQSAVPSDARDAEGYWYGFSKRARVIVYNKNKIKSSDIMRYEDLGNPNWKDRLLLSSAESPLNRTLVASMIASVGADATSTWIRSMSMNLKRPASGTDADNIMAVGKGEADLTLANTNYVARIMRLKRESAQSAMKNVAVLFPDQDKGGAHINIAAIGIGQNAAQKDNAVKLAEFMVSREAQEILTNNNNEYPIVANIPANFTLQSFGTYKASSNIPEHLKNLKEASELMESAGWKNSKSM